MARSATSTSTTSSTTETMKVPVLANVGLKHIKLLGIDSLEQWLEDTNNVYIGHTNKVKGSFDSK